MSWLKRIGKSAGDKNPLLSAMLPEWFVDAVAEGLPQAELHEKVRAFIIESDAVVCAANGTLSTASHPSDAYVELVCNTYRDVLKKNQG